MSSPNTNKSLYEVLHQWFDSFSTVLNCVKIGKIVSFDKTNQTASIQIMHKKKDQYVLEKEALVEYPVLEKVPVVMLGGSSSYITHPVTAGDQCLLLFSDYMIDSWWATGQANPSDFPRKHDISDAIAIVGLRALPNALQNFSDYLNLHYSDNSSIVIGNEVKLKNAITEASGSLDASGTITAPTIIPADGYSGVVYTGAQVLTFANGILISVQ